MELQEAGAANGNASRAAALPLQGVRVLDFTWVWAGPFCTQLLADLGAAVIKVESARRIDNTRLGREPDGAPKGLNRNPGHNQLNRNKRSITCDLSQKRGREVVRRLASVCDIAVENFAPRVLPSLGIGYDDLARVNPGLIMLSMSGLGSSGPLRDTVLYGNSQLALAGMGSLLGYPGGPPENIAFAHGDPVNSYHAFYAILAALWARQRTGKGQQIELSQLEGLLCTMAEGVLQVTMNGREPQRTGNDDPIMAPHNAYRGLERGSWLSIAVRTDEEWQGLSAAMGEPVWCQEARFSGRLQRWRHRAELDRLLQGWVEQYEVHELAEHLQQHGVPAAPMETIVELAADAHLRERGFFLQVDHPETGMKTAIGAPFRLSAARLAEPRHAPRFGEDTDGVLTDLLGYAQTEVAELRESGVLR
ncbi:MAG: CaiB/BaiF CoA transferase family protein [Dehalococcoidia bacterium]